MTPSLNNWIGRLIGDNKRYRLDNRLGGGGMGDVFLAMDTRMGQQVALKLLKDTLVKSGEMRKRFEREVAVCAALQSDHIVKVSDYGVTAEGYPFYVMEYLRGKTLRQLLLNEKRLSVERTVSIMTQVCQGLQLAHKGVTLWRDGATVNEHIKVVHRDLKPDNIFLLPTELGEWVKILDFGIAKIRNESAEQTNLTSTFLGTLRYAAPEQLRGEKDIDGRADIYSLGIILYEMLSHADPFGLSIKSSSQSEASWLIAHTSKPPLPLRSQPGCEQLSPQLEEVVMRCLKKQPDERFATVEELNLVLQAAANSVEKGVVEETIAQPLPLQSEGFHEETIPRRLQPPQSQREETIAQVPPERQSNDITTQSRPVVQSQREETIAQVPLERQSNDITTQPRPIVQSQREETIAQVPPERQSNEITTQPRPIVQNQREETIAQVPLESRREETIAQPQPLHKSSSAKEETIAQSRHPSNSSGHGTHEETIVQPRRKKVPQSLNFLLIGLGIGLVGVMGGIYFYSQFQSRKVVDEIRTLKTQANYEDCMTKSETVSQNSSLYQEVQELQNECRMEYAKKLVKQSKCDEAIATVKKIPESSSFYQKTQTLMREGCEI